MERTAVITRETKESSVRERTDGGRAGLKPASVFLTIC